MYSSDGKFIGGFCDMDDRNFNFDSPRAICTDRTERLLVADKKGIHSFTPEGSFINSIPCSSNPDDVAVDLVGNVHVPMHSANHIAVYSQDGKQIETYDFGGRLKSPGGIYIDGDGNRFASGAELFLIDGNGFACGTGLFLIADSTGELISSRKVDKAMVITGDKNGIIYFAEGIKDRIAIY